MPPIKGAFRNYSEEAMKAAIEDVKLRKTPIRTAARKFGVPRITLKYKVEGKSPIERSMGPPSTLSKLEEKDICQWIENMAAVGFPVTSEELITSVQHLIIEKKRKNLFKNGRPGKTWLKAFLRRNPTVSKRVSQNLTISRASVTNTSIQKWFSEVYNYLKEHNFEKILDDPSRIFNSDETAFFLNPKGNKVLTKKGAKTVYQQVNADEKECVTALLTCSASGLVAPTTILFKYIRTPQEIVNNFPKEWGLGKSDSGWMTCEAFFEFIANIFHPWLLKIQIELPIILFIDGHVSHLSLQTSQFCEKNGIILVALYPNATHLLQPMDVAVFKAVKEAWKKKVHEWRLQNVDHPILKKKDFPNLLKEVIDNTINQSILCNGFRKCGLYPWNPLAVKIPIKQHEIEINKETQLSRINYLQQGLQFLNENIECEKLNTFRCSSEQWSGDPNDTSLFILWKKTQIELGKLSAAEKSVNESEEMAVLSVDTNAENEHSLNTDVIPPQSFLEEDHPNEESQSNNVIPNYVSPSPELHPNNTNNSDIVPSTSNLPTIPSFFEKHLYYSGIRNKNIEKKKNVPKEKMPSIVSGKLFQEFILNKIKKKEENEELKKERAAKRQKNKEEKVRAKQHKEHQPKRRKGKKTCKYSSESSDSSSEIPEFIDCEDHETPMEKNTLERSEIMEKNKLLSVNKDVNEHVIFVYEGEYFPGKILSVTDTKASISSMQKHGRLWKWPETPDVSDYEWENILFHINDPVKTSKTRNIYSIPEIDSIWNYS